jgi:hypothetical protein
MTAAVIIVVALALGTCLFTARLMKRKAAGPGPAGETGRGPGRGQVVGGAHMGGGRSVAPRRDAEVMPDANPGEPTVPVRKRNSPMDL